MSDNRTVHAKTEYAEIVRYDRAGLWYVEATYEAHRTRMPLQRIVEWITEQDQSEVTYHFGRKGGLQFDKRVKAELERVAL